MREYPRLGEVLEMISTDSNTLLALALFRIDPRSEECRMLLHESMVEAALFLSDRPLPSTQIREKMQEMLEQPTGILVEECNAAIERCLEQEKITLTEQGHMLSLHRKEALAQQRDRYADDEKSFDEALVQCVEKELGSPLDDIAKTLLCTAIKTVVLRMFSEKSVELKHAIATSPCDFQTLLAAGSTYDPIKELSGEIEPMVKIYVPNSKSNVIQGVRTFLANLNDAAKRYLTSLHHRVFCFQVLNIDPKLRELQDRCFTNTRLYLDTNVMLRFLFDAHPFNQAVNDLLGACNALQIQLFVSPATYSELVNKVSQAKRVITERGAKGIPAIITDTLEGRSSEPILSTFATKKRAQSSLTWGAFIAPYEESEMVTYLLHRNILVEKEKYEAVREDENYHRVWQTIRDIRHPDISDRIIDHDADNFVLIHKLRASYPDNPLIGPCVWLITSDHSLKKSEDRLFSIYDTPHCRLIEEWGEFLIPFQNVGQFVFSDYISYLVASKFGVLIEEQTLDLSILGIIYDPELNLEDFWNLPLELQLKMISSMNRDRSSRELQERARTAITAEEKTQIADDFRKKEVAILAAESDRTEQQVERLFQQVSQLRDELERVRNAYESMSFWDRLKALFRI